MKKHAREPAIPAGENAVFVRFERRLRMMGIFDLLVQKIGKGHGVFLEEVVGVDDRRKHVTAARAEVFSFVRDRLPSWGAEALADLFGVDRGSFTNLTRRWPIGGTLTATDRQKKVRPKPRKRSKPIGKKGFRKVSKKAVPRGKKRTGAR